MTRWFATLVAPVPAAVLLALGLWWAPPRADDREDPHHGFVLGGVFHQGGIGPALDAILDREPRVLVIGNSNARSDIDPRRLAAGLGVDAEDVATLSIPSSSAVHWIAILRRLGDRGARPKLILVVSRLQLVLVDEPISDGATRSLEALLRPDDHDLRPEGGRWATEVRHRREALRDGLGTILRAWLPRALGAAEPEGVLRQSLSDDRIDIVRLGRPPSRPLPSPETSWVSELARTARRLDIDLVVARPPLSPIVGPDDGDVVPDGYAERTRDLLVAGGARWADLSALGMQRYHYRDPDHLDAEGARRLTAALLAFLRPPRGHRVDAVGAVRFVDGVLVRDLGVVRFAAPPPILPSAEPSWDGAIGAIQAPSVPDDRWTQRATELSVRCSPLRVVMDGRILEPAPCDELRPGTSCHRGAEVTFRAPDHGGRDGSLVLDPERSCDGARWLYPGDRAEIRWPSPLADARLEVEVVGWGSATVEVALRDGAHGVATSGRTLVLPVSSPDPVLDLHSEGYVLVTRAELVAP